MEREKVYLAGPMSGIPDFNYPRFNRAAEEIRKQGYDVLNPAEIDGGVPQNRPWSYYMRKALGMMLQADKVALLKGWRESLGASFEALCAALLDMPVVSADTMKPFAREGLLYNTAITHFVERLAEEDEWISRSNLAEDLSVVARAWSATMNKDVTLEMVRMALFQLEVLRSLHRINQPKVLVDLAEMARKTELHSRGSHRVGSWYIDVHHRRTLPMEWE